MLLRMVTIGNIGNADTIMYHHTSNTNNYDHDYTCNEKYNHKYIIIIINEYNIVY